MSCNSILHQRIVAFDLMRFAAGHVESQRVALGVRAEMDFSREAAARAAERFLILIPPFTPAACWCARTMVESMACSAVDGAVTEPIVRATGAEGALVFPPNPDCKGTSLALAVTTCVPIES